MPAATKMDPANPDQLQTPAEETTVDSPPTEEITPITSTAPSEPTPPSDPFEDPRVQSFVADTQLAQSVLADLLENYTQEGRKIPPGKFKGGKEDIHVRVRVTLESAEGVIEEIDATHPLLGALNSRRIPSLPRTIENVLFHGLVQPVVTTMLEYTQDRERQREIAERAAMLDPYGSQNGVFPTPGELSEPPGD